MYFTELQLDSGGEATGESMSNADQSVIDLLRIADRQALEAFVVENADLERLEGLIEQFNIFEAVGAVRQELRHSDFLAFLLDPRQNHRLGDAFVRRLLQRVLIAAQNLESPVSPVHLDAWDLGRLAVRREWRSIDIVLEDESNRLVVVIENKIDAAEHSDQLGLTSALSAPSTRHRHGDAWRST